MEYWTIFLGVFLEMDLKTMLRESGIDPKRALVLRHTPHEPKLKQHLPSLVAERPDLFNAYQQTQQGVAVEGSFTRADYIVSFIGHKSKQAVFVGLYQKMGSTELTREEYWRMDAYQELRERYGMEG